jgi:glutaredoxin
MQEHVMYYVYSKDNCAFCQQAKSLLLIKNLPFKVLNLDKDYTLEEFRTKFPEQKTFPMIVHMKHNFELEEKYYIEIGGFDKLREYLK